MKWLLLIIMVVVGVTGSIVIQEGVRYESGNETYVAGYDITVDSITHGDTLELGTQGFNVESIGSSLETEIEYFSYDLKNPKVFWVYPKVHATTNVYVDMDHSYLFDEVLLANITTTDVACDDMFIGPIEDWMKKRAYDVDTDSSVNQSIALKFEESFYKSLGLEFQSKARISSKPGRRSK